MKKLFLISSKHAKTYFSNNIHAFGNFSKHNMFSIKPTSLGAGDKELAAVGVGASICHREYTGLSMSQLKVFIFEPRTVNGFATSTVVVGEITTLAHEIWNHPVEATTLVAETLLTRAQRTEILRRLGDNILPQLKNIKIKDSVEIIIYLTVTYKTTEPALIKIIKCYKGSEKMIKNTVQ